MCCGGGGNGNGGGVTEGLVPTRLPCGIRYLGFNDPALLQQQGLTTSDLCILS